MGATAIPREYLWCERWPVWGYVCVKSVHFSSSLPQPKIASYAPASCGAGVEIPVKYQRPRKTT